MQRLSKPIIKFFTSQLLQWHRDHPRDMPWKDTKDPYFIWLSEIILQQTRVAQGLPYYLKFIDKYPTVHHLAEASEDDILSDWQGLGYYSRARNLHAAAKYIKHDLEGVFPATYDGIRRLKGVGPYSAAAIGSFAFDLPYSVVDGNVKRVLSRFFDIQESIDLPATHRLIEQMANLLMPETKAALFNQAIMNFGALQCEISNPNCDQCPLVSECLAFKNDTVSERPVRSPKRKRENRYFHYFVLTRGDNFLLERRTNEDIWKNMFTFPAEESTNARKMALTTRDEMLRKYIDLELVVRKEKPLVMTQLLTHRKIIGTFYRYHLSDSTNFINDHSNLVSSKNLSNFALPKIIADYINEQLIRNR